MGRTIIFLRTSERSSYKRCRFAWDLAYNQELKPKRSSPPLRFGSLVHAAMEERYILGKKRGEHPALAFERLYEEELKEQEKFGFKDEDGTWHDALALGVDMLEHFVDVYGDDDEWEVLATECAFQVPVKTTKTYQLVYVGQIDGVWRNRRTKDIYLKDWKTTKSISATNTNYLTLDDQPAAYWTFGPEYLRMTGYLKKTQKLRGIHFTYLRKAMRDERPRNAHGECLNKDGSVSKNQPAPYFKNVPTHRTEAEMDSTWNRVQAEAREMRLVREGKLDILKSPGAMNCAMCGYRDVCELHESGQDWEAFRDQTLVHWDPYAAHEVYAAET